MIRTAGKSSSSTQRSWGQSHVPTLPVRKATRYNPKVYGSEGQMEKQGNAIDRDKTKSVEQQAHFLLGCASLCMVVSVWTWWYLMSSTFLTLSSEMLVNPKSHRLATQLWGPTCLCPHCPNETQLSHGCWWPKLKSSCFPGRYLTAEPSP